MIKPLFNILLLASSLSIHLGAPANAITDVQISDVEYIEDIFGRPKWETDVEVKLPCIDYNDSSNFTVCVKTYNQEDLKLPLGYSYDTVTGEVIYRLPSISEVAPNHYIKNDGFYIENDYYGPANEIYVGSVSTPNGAVWKLIDRQGNVIIPRSNVTAEQINNVLDNLLY